MIEVTETTAIADLDRSSDAIERLRGIDVTVSVDDFGAGTTSLTYLRVAGRRPCLQQSPKR